MTFVESSGQEGAGPILFSKLLDLMLLSCHVIICVPINPSDIIGSHH
jgi:hypothetical protein